MIDNLVNTDAIPALERMIQFTGQRHRLIANNVANFTTAGYVAMDVDPKEFQQALGEAIDRTREPDAGAAAELKIEDTDAVTVNPNSLTLNPTPRGGNILFHDGNDRDIERTMQDLVENFMMFRTASEMIRNRFDMVNLAIRERI